MGFDTTLFGAKLARRREAQGFSRVDLYKVTGIAEERLGGLECGAEEPSGDEVLILADALKVDFRFFVSADVDAPDDQLEVLFRQYGDRVQAADRRAVAELLYLCDTERLFMEVLGRQGTMLPFRFHKRGNHYKTHGIEAATHLRSHLGLQPSALVGDVFRVARRLGVHVFRRRLPDQSISGLTIRHKTAGPCIVVNYEDDPYRQRFTLAHELGHVVLDEENDVIVSFWKQDDLVELRANAFAGELLAPADGLRPLRTRGVDHERFVELAHQLETNAGTLARQLRSAGVIDDGGFGQFHRLRLPRADKPDPELPDGLSDRQKARKSALLERGLSQYYVELCLDAYDQAEISFGRLAEALLVSEGEVSDIAALYGRKVKHGA